MAKTIQSAIQEKMLPKIASATSLFFCALSTFFKVKLKSVRMCRFALVLVSVSVCLRFFFFCCLSHFCQFSRSRAFLISLSLQFRLLLLTQFCMFGKHKKSLKNTKKKKKRHKISPRQKRTFISHTLLTRIFGRTTIYVCDEMYRPTENYILYRGICI